MLKQLDVNESSPGPAEVVVAIRKWYRLLQRAADLNIALPDESCRAPRRRVSGLAQMLDVGMENSAPSATRGRV